MLDDFPQNVQVISFPLECFGLLLVCIELFREYRADQIEVWIDSLPYKVRQFNFVYYLPHATALALVTFIASIYYIVLNKSVYVFISNWVKQSGLIISSIEYFLIALFIAIPIIFFISIRSISFSVIRYLNHISGGNALGTIGLMSGFMGLVCESLQMFIGTTASYKVAGIFVLSIALIGFFAFVVRGYTDEEMRGYTEAEAANYNWAPSDSLRVELDHDSLFLHFDSKNIDLVSLAHIIDTVELPRLKRSSKLQEERAHAHASKIEQAMIKHADTDACD